MYLPTVLAASLYLAESAFGFSSAERDAPAFDGFIEEPPANVTAFGAGAGSAGVGVGVAAGVASASASVAGAADDQRRRRERRQRP